MKKYLILNVFMLCATLSFSQNDVTLGMRIAALRYPEVGMPQENLMPVVASGKIGFVNHDGELVLPPTYDKERDIESYRFRDGLMIVKKNGKYGYLNTKLEEVIPCQFEEARPFDDGLAAVKKDKMWGFIDKKGENVIPFGYKRVCSFSFGLAAVVGDQDSIGFIDKFGIIAIPFQFDNAGQPAFMEDGRCAVKKNGVGVFINKKGEIIGNLSEGDAEPQWSMPTSFQTADASFAKTSYQLAETPYDDAWPFVDGYSIVMKKEGNEKRFGVVSIKGKEVVPCSYDQISGPFRGPVSYFIIKKSTGYGAYDVDGKEILPCEYQSIGKEGSQLIMIEKDGKKGFADASGKVVIPCQFEDARPFNAASVTAVEEKKKDKMVWNFIDRTGKVIASPAYDDALAFVNGVCPVQRKGKWGFVNESLKEISSLKYEYTFSDIREKWSYLRSLPGDPIPVSRAGKYGFIDIRGKEVIKCQYDEALAFRNGLARVKQNGAVIYIDKKGQVVDNQTPANRKSIRQSMDEQPVVTKEKSGMKALVYEDETSGKETVTPYIFDDFGANYIDGLAPVKVVGKWGLINAKGEIVVPCIYDGVEISEQGTAIVRVGSKKGFINKMGESLLPLSNVAKVQWIPIRR